MIRKIIKINSEKCNGCGICAEACHESAIAIIDSKAQLIRDDYCDGLGNCLPVCPMSAIAFEEREALPYDEVAVEENMQKKKKYVQMHTANSALKQWPVQIKLIATSASFLRNSDVLIAADCTAYAYAGFHQKFMHEKVTMIGCPKLDAVDYSKKLAEIFKQNDIHSVTVTRMIVPCCGGIEHAVKEAIKHSGKQITCKIITIDTNGRICK